MGAEGEIIRKRGKRDAMEESVRDNAASRSPRNHVISALPEHVPHYIPFLRAETDDKGFPCFQAARNPVPTGSFPL